MMPARRETLKLALAGVLAAVLPVRPVRAKPPPFKVPKITPYIWPYRADREARDFYAQRASDGYNRLLDLYEGGQWSVPK